MIQLGRFIWLKFRTPRNADENDSEYKTRNDKERRRILHDYFIKFRGPFYLNDYLDVLRRSCVVDTLIYVCKNSKVISENLFSEE